jgi:fibronectin type 3 domain-containing protein
MLRRVCWVGLLMSVAVSAIAQTIYWKKDHIYNGPSGKEIAVVMPQPTDQTAPTAPTGLTLGTVTATSVQLSWSASTDSGGSGLAGYKVYRQQGVGANLPVGTVGAGVLSFTDQPLTPGTGYTWTIVAYDNAENHSTASNSASTTTASSSGDTTPPSTPTNLTGTGTSSTTIQLNWNASTDTGGSGMGSYRVYRGGSLIASPTTTSYLDTGLTANTSYSYSVAAVDNAGNNSATSSAVPVSTPRNLVFKDTFARADGAPNLTGCSYSAGSCWNYAWAWTTLAHHATYPIPPSAAWSVAPSSVGLTGDTKATVTITNNPNGAGVYFWDNYPNAYPALNWYMAYVVGTTLKLSYFSYGWTETVLATASVSSSTGTISAEAVASSHVIKVSFNGTVLINYTETDYTRPTSGRAGMVQYNTPSATSQVYLDNFILQD